MLFCIKLVAHKFMYFDPIILNLNVCTHRPVVSRLPQSLMEKRTERDETRTRIKRMRSPEGRIVVNPNRSLPRGKHLKKR